jgi:hypothetical protein
MNGRRMFIRSLDLSTFVFSIVLFVDKHPPSIFTLRFRVLRRSISTAVMLGVTARGYCSGLLLGVTARPAKRERVKARSNAQCCSEWATQCCSEWATQCCSEWAFLRRLCSVSLYTIIGCREFGDITIDDSQYGLADSRRLHRLFYGSETSLLRFHSYLNYTTRRNILP